MGMGTSATHASTPRRWSMCHTRRVKKMDSQTWHVTIAISSSDDDVYADAVLVDGPALAIGHGHACRSGGSDVRRDQATAARRAVSELTQSMRMALELAALPDGDQVVNVPDRRAS